MVQPILPIFAAQSRLLLSLYLFGKSARNFTGNFWSIPAKTDCFKTGADMNKLLILGWASAIGALCIVPAFAQSFGSQSSLSGNSGSNNVVQASGATNRPFQNNNSLNQLNNPSGFNAITNFNTMNNMNGPVFQNFNGTATAPMNNSTVPTDESITSDVRRSLISPGLSANARNSNVMTTNGVVTLTGTVASQQEKNLLEQNARGSAGVHVVVNNLQIRPTQ
jgi:hypothetical protein